MGSQSLARGLQAKKKLLTSRPEEGVECFHKDGSSLMITDSSHIFSHDFVEVSEVLFFFKILIDALQSGGTISWYIILLMPLLIAENEDLCETEQCRV